MTFELCTAVAVTRVLLSTYVLTLSSNSLLGAKF